MSAQRDFDALVFAYLDGDASEQQVLALRDALRRDPALRARLAAMVRLHRAQSTVLSRRAPALPGVVSALRDFADRAGRCLAHACVLALVFVELDVAVPGVDARAWLEPEPSLVADVREEPEPDTASVSEMSSEEDVAPLPDVREPDFLES